MASWNTLNPILSLSEWIGDRTRSSKFTKRDLNNNMPPLLQQAMVDEKYHEAGNQANVSNEQDADGFVHVHHGSFSTFASRRNNRNHVPVGDEDRESIAKDKRSSVVISNKEEGGLYILSSENKKRKRDEGHTLRRADNDRYNSRPFVQQKREDDGVPGTVDIMVRVFDFAPVLRLQV
jgi:hypothetical protein